MIRLQTQLFLAYCVFFSGIVRADEDVIQAKLESAIAKYDTAMEKSSKEVHAFFDDREKEAIRDGEKKRVDQITEDRRLFDTERKIPRDFPRTPLTKRSTATKNLEEAYKVAIRDYTKANNLAKASDKEIELQRFQNSALVNNWLATVQYIRKKHNRDWFSTNGTVFGRTVSADRKPFKNAIFAHPGPFSVSEVSFSLNSEWDVLSFECGVPTLGDEKYGIKTPIRFVILGDNREIWRSKPVRNYDDFQRTSLDIRGVKNLVLKVECPGSSGYARAVWFEPQLLRH